MTSKLKFLLPDVATANQVAGSLMLAKIENEDICFIAKPGIDFGQLQGASIIESPKVINDEENDGKWIWIGAAIGLLTGLVLHYIDPGIASSMGIHWITVVAIASLIGAFAFAALFGVDFFGVEFKKYKSKIDSGAILLIVTAPFHRANEIRLIVNKSYLKY
jgi:hypothetical protein